MKNNLRIKRIGAMITSAVIIFSTVLPNLSLTAHAQVSSNALTVTAGSSQTATFTHEHKNAGSIVTKQIQSNSTVTGATVSGYCYTTKNQHIHEGNTTSGGNCYDVNYHVHTDACYNHHVHTDNCKNWKSKYSFKKVSDNQHDYTHAYGFTCCCGDYIGDGGYMQDGGYRAYNHTWAECCNSGNPSLGVTHTYCFLWWDNQNNRWGADNTCGKCWNPWNVSGVSNKNAPWSGTVRNNEYVYWQESFGYTCGYTAGQQIGSPICGKTTSTPEGYKLKTTCPYYTDPIYTNSCGIASGATIAKATVSADNNNMLTCTISDTITGKTNYSFYWVKPDGSIVNNTDNIQCTEIGTYKCVVNVKTKINNQTVDDDTVTFSYTAVPHNTTVNFYDYNNVKLDVITMKRGSEKTSITKPSRTGYTFTGYYLDNGSTQYYNQNGAKVVNNFCPLNGGTINLYAKYTANQYTIDYETHNLTVDTTLKKQDTATYDQAITLSNDAKAYTGYTFDGWYNGNTKLFNTDRTFTSAKWNIPNNVTLSAKYHANSYTLYYSLNKTEDVSAHSKTVNYDANYGLTAAEIASRPDYTGYTFNGWYDGNTKIYNADGSNAVAGPWKWTKNINAKAKYTANPYKVYYNTKESDAPSTVLNVTYDANYALPSASVSAVPAKSGYTFDGWFDTTTNAKIFNTDGTPVSNPYKFDHDITVMVKYHKNTYIINYNDEDINDNDLNQSQTVTFDTAYLPINQAPYKVGYVFDGHQLEGTLTFIWDGHGDIIHAVWDFLCGADGTSVNAKKVYSPKTFTVDIGNDFDDDGVIDSIESTKTATYDATFFDLNKPAYINGYTFDGYYLLENGVWVATYDYDTDTLTKTSNTWTWDDHVNWNNDPHTNFTLVRKWHKNIYHIKYNNTEVADTNLNKILDSEYNVHYDDIAVAPYKTGYIFDGHYFVDYSGNEVQIWDNIGKASRTAFDFAQNPTNGTITNAYKKYHAKTFNVEIGDDYDENGTLDNVDITETATYNATYFSLPIPSARTGLTFDGYYILGTNTCVAKYNEATGTLSKTSNTWIWDDGEDWNNNPSHNDTIRVESCWTHNQIEVTVNTETSTKTTPGTGNLSSYTFDVTTRTEYYDRPYTNIAVPVKRGYTFVKYIVSPKNASEEEVIFKSNGEQKLSTFLWTGVTDPNKVNIISVFDKKRITGDIPTKKYDPKTQTETDNPIHIDETYDEPYNPLPLIPEKAGYDFDGITDKDGNPIWDKDGNPKQDVWQYIEDDIDDFIPQWKPKTYILEYANGKTETITYDAAVNKLDTMSKSGFTFSGYSFNFFGKEINVFNGSGEFTSDKWTYDVGPSGTVIKLKDLWNVNSYKITIKNNSDLTPDSEMDVVFQKGYNNCSIPKKTGYVFTGYVLEYNEEHPDELSKPIWNEDGTPSENAYEYAHNITVLATWKAKVFYLHFGDEVLAVTYNENTGMAPVLTKDSYSDTAFTYDYTFEGWTLMGDTLFNELGEPVTIKWTRDLGDNGAHFYLDEEFNEIKTEIPKPEEPVPTEPTPEEPIVVIPEPELIDPEPQPTWVETIWRNPVVKTIIITGGVSIPVFAILFVIFFILAHICSVYYIADVNNKKYKHFKGFEWINTYKKSKRDTYTKHFVELSKEHRSTVKENEDFYVMVRFNRIFAFIKAGKNIDIGIKDELRNYDIQRDVIL